MDEVALLQPRVTKLPPRILRDPETAALILKNAGWGCRIVDENLPQTLEFARERRKQWLAERRERRRREREADRAWRAQYAKGRA